MSCKMGGRTRQWFCILAGVLQGGILSPSFYSLYVDDLKLEKLNVGSYVMDVLMAALLYADNMAILAPSMKGLQLLLDNCSEYCEDWDICLNAKNLRCYILERNAAISFFRP